MAFNELKEKQVVLFDGVCNLCNRFVHFIILRDKQDRLRFASLQGDSAASLLASFREKGRRIPDSVVLLKNGKLYTESGAALRILGSLNGLWPLMLVFLMIPPFIRNPVYRVIAKNRYRWFGKQENCRLMNSEISDKFFP